MDYPPKAPELLYGNKGSLLFYSRKSKRILIVFLKMLLIRLTPRAVGPRMKEIICFDYLPAKMFLTVTI